MENKSSIELLTKRNLALFLIALIFLVIAFLYSKLTSTPTITINQENPPTFHMSGKNTIIVFEVVSNEKVIWKLYPKDNGLSLTQLLEVKYGQVPLSCEQAFPENMTQPPPLVEGEKYRAFAGIFDDSAVGVNFTIQRSEERRVGKEC